MHVRWGEDPHDPGTSVLHPVVGSYNGLQLGERIRFRV